MLSFLNLRLPPTSTLFPYTTLFRSVRHANAGQNVFNRDDYATPSRSAVHWFLPLKFLGFLYMSIAAQWIRAKDRKSTRLNSSHVAISYAVFCLKKKSVVIYSYMEEH